MKNANHYFGTTNGFENFYRHNLSQIHYTDGVKELGEKCSPNWLIDLIISLQCHDHVKAESFLVWDLNRVEGNSFTMIATDCNYNKVTSREIPISDFPYDLATVWFVDDCMMLPCEY